MPAMAWASAALRSQAGLAWPHGWLPLGGPDRPLPSSMPLRKQRLKAAGLCLFGHLAPLLCQASSYLCGHSLNAASVLSMAMASR